MPDDFPQAFELRIEPGTAKFDPDDDRWRNQVAQLYSGLRDQAGAEVRRRHVGVEGTKGGIDTVILALGSAGAFTAAAEYLRAWLGRDKSRTLDVTWSADGQEHSVSIRGDGMDNASFQALAEAAASRMSGGMQADAGP